MNDEDAKENFPDLVLNLAAQSIQAAYKRYRECRFDVRLRRISSTENLVMNLAAQTISSGLRRNLHLKKRMKQKRIHVDKNDQLQSRSRIANLIISNLKTIDLPSVLREGDREAFIFLKTFTESLEVPTWQYKICGTIASSRIEWGNINVSIPLEEEGHFYEKLVLRIELYYKSSAVKDQLMGQCECDLCAAYSELLDKQTSTIPLKAVASYLHSADSFVIQHYGDKKPVVNFSLYLEAALIPLVIPPRSPKTNINDIGVSIICHDSNTIKNNEPMITKGNVSSKPIIAALNFAASSRPNKSTAMEMNISTSMSFRSETPSPRVSRDMMIVSQATSTASEVSPMVIKVVDLKSIDKNRKSKVALTAAPGEEENKGTAHSFRKNKVNKDNIQQTLFDEMFNMAFRKHASIITVSLKELCIILDSLDLPISEPFLAHLTASSSSSIPEGSSPPNSSRFFATLSLPILHTPSLAATLSQEIRDNHILDMNKLGSIAGSGIISAQQAEIIKDQLIGLVKGDYSRVKGHILKACMTSVSRRLPNSVDSNAIRPSMWSQKNVQLFLTSLGLETESFQSMSGHDLIFMSTDRETLKRQYNIGASLLQKRFVIYHLTLVYIDKWWDRGMRPSVQFSKADFNEFVQSRKMSFKNQTKKTKDCHIRISDCESLLREMIQFNRAYGWGIPYGTLSYFCSRLGGQSAVVVFPSSFSNDDSLILNNATGCTLSDSKDFSRVGYQLEETKGCKWVKISIEFHDMLHEDHPLMDSILKCSVSASDGIAINDSQDVTDILALIPAACCCKCSDKVKQELDVFEQLDVPNTLLIEAEIQVGLFASIVDYDRLVRLCRRFEWWDRPSNEFLQSVGGKYVEVVSVNHNSSRRIGVKCIDSDVCDALPLEAFVSITAKNPKSTNIDGIKKRKKKKAKVAKKEVNLSDTVHDIKHAVSNVFENKGRELSAHSVLSNLSEDANIKRDDSILNNKDDSKLSKLDPILMHPTKSIPSSSFPPDSASVSSLIGIQFESNTEMSPQFKKDHSWMKPISKLDQTLLDASDDTNEKDASNVSKSRRYFPHPTVNLTFPATSPVASTRIEHVTNGSPLSSKKQIYQRPKENYETTFANVEYFPISSNDGHSGQQFGNKASNHSSNNFNTGINNASVRPKSAPSNSKRPTTTASKPPDPPTSKQQLEVQGVNLFTRSGSFRVPAASDLVVSEVSPTSDHVVERQTIRDLKHNESNNERLSSATSSSKRPSSAGSTKQRHRRQQNAVECKTQPIDPHVVSETPQRALLRKYYGLNDNVEDDKVINEQSGTAETAKRRKTPIRDKRRGFVNLPKHRQVEGDAEMKEKEREGYYKQKETVLSQREANFKDNYLLRQLKRLGVGSSDT